MSDEPNYDLIIVGAGMVGASLACALSINKGSANESRKPMKIALVDAQCAEMQWPDKGYDMRVSALTRATQLYLQDLGVWPYIEAERSSPYREMHVWDATGDGVIHFDSAEIGEPDLGHIIENRVTVKALHQRLSELANVDVLCPLRLSGVSFDDESVSLFSDDERKLTAGLVVAADGARSWLRQQAGISITGWDYDQHALVTWVKTEHYHQDTAWQRFQADGPLAFLPLTEGYSSIVWSTSPEHAKALCDMEEHRFAEALADAFEHKLGAIEEVGPRGVFPLRYFETNAYVKPRLALIGDAAHLMHPLAGQGVNLGMADAAALAQVLNEAWAEKRDIGEMRVLRRYERWRRADNRTMLLAMDSFKKLFSSHSEAVRLMRNTGLNIVDHVPLIKHMFMHKALG